MLPNLEGPRSRPNLTRRPRVERWTLRARVVGAMAYQAESRETDWDQWSAEGPRLAAAIQAELGPTAYVDYRPN